eukprot:RCo019666
MTDLPQSDQLAVMCEGKTEQIHADLLLGAVCGQCRPEAIQRRIQLLLVLGAVQLVLLPGLYGSHPNVREGGEEASHSPSAFGQNKVSGGQRRPDATVGLLKLLRQPGKPVEELRNLLAVLLHTEPAHSVEGQRHKDVPDVGHGVDGRIVFREVIEVHRRGKGNERDVEVVPGVLSAERGQAVPQRLDDRRQQHGGIGGDVDAEDVVQGKHSGGVLGGALGLLRSLLLRLVSKEGIFCSSLKVVLNAPLSKLGPFRNITPHPICIQVAVVLGRNLIWDLAEVAYPLSPAVRERHEGVQVGPTPLATERSTAAKVQDGDVVVVVRSWGQWAHQHRPNESRVLQQLRVNRSRVQGRSHDIGAAVALVQHAEVQGRRRGKGLPHGAEGALSPVSLRVGRGLGNGAGDLRGVDL